MQNITSTFQKKFFSYLEELDPYSTIVYLDGIANTTERISGYVFMAIGDGSHNITIVMSDWAGNEIVTSILFTIN